MTNSSDCRSVAAKLTWCSLYMYLQSPCVRRIRFDWEYNEKNQLNRTTNILFFFITFQHISRVSRLHTRHNVIDIFSAIYTLGRRETVHKSHKVTVGHNAQAIVISRSGANSFSARLTQTRQHRTRFFYCFAFLFALFLFGCRSARYNSSALRIGSASE